MTGYHCGNCSNKNKSLTKDHSHDDFKPDPCGQLSKSPTHLGTRNLEQTGSDRILLYLTDVDLMNCDSS